MRLPYEMEQVELAELVARIQRQLYFEQDPKKVFVWNPAKDVDCQAFVDILDELMARSELHPGFVEFRKPYVHRPQEVEFLEKGEESLSGPLQRNPELSINEGRLIGHLSPNMQLSDIVFPPTLSKLILLKRRDVEDLRSLCDQLLEFMRD